MRANEDCANLIQIHPSLPDAQPAQDIAMRVDIEMNLSNVPLIEQHVRHIATSQLAPNGRERLVLRHAPQSYLTSHDTPASVLARLAIAA